MQSRPRSDSSGKGNHRADADGADSGREERDRLLEQPYALDALDEADNQISSPEE